MKNGDKHDLRQRTKQFAIRIVRLYTALPRTPESQVIGKQALRSGMSVVAHYREALRARSTAEFVSKLHVGLQELDETDYWLELLTECEIIPAKKLAPLRSELGELIAILVSSINTAKRRKKD